MTKAYLRRQRRKAAKARRNGTFFVPSGTSLTNFTYGTQYYGTAPIYSPPNYAYSTPMNANFVMTSPQAFAGGAPLTVETVSAAAEAGMNRGGSVAGSVEAITQAFEAGLLSDTQFLRTLGL